MVRALLDSGSQGCIVSSWLVNRLALKLRPHRDFIRGIGDIRVTNLRGHVKFDFSPVSVTKVIRAPGVVMDNILGTHPQTKLSPSIVALTSNMRLADPKFHIPGPVDLLLGADVLGQLFLGCKKVLQPKGLVAFSSIFGYTLWGPVLPVLDTIAEEFPVFVGVSLSEVVQKFWETEEPPSALRTNPEHEECELFFRNNTGRSCSGRIVTRLPFLASRPLLGESRRLAEQRLLSMEKRMKRDVGFHNKYVEFMREYEFLGHMSVTPFDWSSMEHYFIPHHAVFKNPDAKIRVVFDGSAPSTTGVSLNQCLHSGPKLHRNICELLTNFRRHQIVFVADIRMMFRQTIIHPDDRRYQLILWRESTDQPMLVYELNTNTYGLKSSPFIAIRSLLELAERERLNYPRAAAILGEDVYVDDICSGASSEKEALILRDELIRLLKAGGYELRKWLSNSPSLLEGLPEEHKQLPYVFEDCDNPDFVAVLGVQYKPVQDVFTYKVDIEKHKVWTKRLLLSTIARTFDPNGWIGPVIFLAKCFLQRLWTAGVSWDEPLSGDILKDWLSFVSSLPDVNKISMPRLFLPSGPYKASFHGFCDASERGYAAAVYLRCVDATGVVSVHLVMSKSKVAPLRSRLTIPKLELCGAALLVRLCDHISSTLGAKIDVTESFAWTDSQIVLCWLRTAVHNLEVFVANRVSQIQGFKHLIWRHVPGDINPADCASRGCEATDLMDHSLWWGPRWLLGNEKDWPNNQLILSEPLPGLRSLAVERIQGFDPDLLLNRYSSLDKLLAVTGWIQRFANNSRSSQPKRCSPLLEPLELREALLIWIRAVQLDSFSNELEILNKGNNLKGHLSRLNPFVDSTGLLRVGGRLRNANLPYGARHPLLLPNKGHLVHLLVSDRHLKNAHAGSNALLAILQREFWILSARRVIRSVVFRCIPCYKLKAKTLQPQMGDLPTDRVTENRPFVNVGTDFAGPFMVKSSQLRNAKRVKAYLCVFVCLSTKAVHLELVSALSTEAFVATLARFVSRRGLPTAIRSDCGTNFVGTNNYLKDVYKFLIQNKVEIGTTLSRRGIIWKFDPPACPHWGGIFEAVVKVSKTHLQRVIGDTVLSFEDLTTVFCKIEAVLNSRPLCPLSSDSNDLEVLTPGHFLIGQPLNALPEYPLRDINVNRLKRYETLQQISQNFWHRWSLEYLHILQQRIKWSDKTNPPKIGDLVLVKDSNLQSLHWRRGRIVNLVYGSDGIPRFAEVKVGDSVLKRAVATLSRLPID